MEKKGNIEICIQGKKGNIELTPDNFDIRDIKPLLDTIEDLLFPGDKKNRPVISYEITEGSVRHIFKTGIQFIIGFNAILGQINTNQNIDFLDSPTAKAFEEFQNNAIKHDYIFTINTSISASHEIKIDKTTKYYRTESMWADAEFYFYGKIIDIGGKDKANIHLATEDLGTLIIQTPKEEIERIETNPLYKTFGIRAVGMQHPETGEIDKHSLRFIEILNYQPKYDIEYLKSLRQKAMNNWLYAINPDKWLRELRGGYDA